MFDVGLHLRSTSSVHNHTRLGGREFVNAKSYLRQLHNATVWQPNGNRIALLAKTAITSSVSPKTTTLTRKAAAMGLTAIVVDANCPIADGIPFDDTLGFSRRQIQLLKARRILFNTRFRDEAGDRWYGGVIIATDLDAARAVAFGRGLGEEVLGELV